MSERIADNRIALCNEALNRARNLLKQYRVDRYEHVDFTVMRGTTSIQIYSKRISRVVMLYSLTNQTFRSLESASIEAVNMAELYLLVGIMKRHMVLDDLADV